MMRTVAVTTAPSRTRIGRALSVVLLSCEVIYCLWKGCFWIPGIEWKGVEMLGLKSGALNWMPEKITPDSNLRAPPSAVQLAPLAPSNGAPTSLVSEEVRFLFAPHIRPLSRLSPAEPGHSLRTPNSRLPSPTARTNSHGVRKLDHVCSRLSFGLGRFLRRSWFQRLVDSHPRPARCQS
jgi:hypothetical protein